MLIRESCFPQSGMVFVMSDIAIIAAFTKKSLHDLSGQLRRLGEGLQNAAPGEKMGAPNKSVQYLLAAADHLMELAAECDEIIRLASQSRLDSK
jgi:hypothetical protein